MCKSALIPRPSYIKESEFKCSLWRGGRDSNSRERFPFSGVKARRPRPLGDPRIFKKGKGIYLCTDGMPKTTQFFYGATQLSVRRELDAAFFND